MNLDTTNLLLGVLAAAAVVQVALLIAGGVLVYRGYARTMRMVEEIEARHVVPLVQRIDGLIGRADQAMGRVEPLMAGAARVNRVVSAVDRVRQAFGGFFNGRRSSSEAPEHAEAGTGTVR